MQVNTFQGFQFYFTKSTAIIEILFHHSDFLPFEKKDKRIVYQLVYLIGCFEFQLSTQVHVHALEKKTRDLDLMWFGNIVNVILFLISTTV